MEGKAKQYRPPNPSESNEEEFQALIKCITSLKNLTTYFEGKPTVDNPRHGCVRISHQGNYPMKTWLKGNPDSTLRQKELKPDLMSIVVDLPEKRSKKYVKPARPQTILPPPPKWNPPPIDDTDSPIVECKEPEWECLDLFWECKRNSLALGNADIYIDCALKASEALRYQWSRRYIYCFLHCGTKMELLHFDRSGLVVSEPLDIKNDTAKFIRCLLGVFYHKPSRLGYPAGETAPTQLIDPEDGTLRQVVNVKGRQLYLGEQHAIPPRDHLVSRGTCAFKAKLVHPKEGEGKGWIWCYKSSWPQQQRTHEGKYLEKLQGLSNVVRLLIYSTEKVDNNDDTTGFARGVKPGPPVALSGPPVASINKYYNREKPANNTQSHTGSKSLQDARNTSRTGSKNLESKVAENQGDMPPDTECDEREHRVVVTAWVKSSFDEAISSLDDKPSPDSLKKIFSTWEQAFSVVKAISKMDIYHRDMSFQNVRVDDKNQVMICDFDMAISRNESTGASDRTGTVAFMATSLLGNEPVLHQPVHDCESLFWLCALGLLKRIAIGNVKTAFEMLTDPRSDLATNDIEDVYYHLFKILYGG